MAKEYPARECVMCGKFFRPHHDNCIVCGDVCRKAYHKQYMAAYKKNGNVPPRRVGRKPTMSIDDVCKASSALGMSYGQFVAFMEG